MQFNEKYALYLLKSITFSEVAVILTNKSHRESGYFIEYDCMNHLF